MVKTLASGRAAGGRVPSRLAPGPLLLACVTAPCRWITPERSLYQAGARDPQHALPDQFSVFTGIGTGVEFTVMADLVAAWAETVPVTPRVATPRAAATVLSPAASWRIGRPVRDMVRFMTWVSCS